MMSFRYCRSIFLYLIFMSSTGSVYSSKILFFNGMGEGSHFSAAAALGEELAFRGHQVSFLVSSEFKHLAESPKYYNLFEFIIINTGVSMAPFYVHLTQAKFDGLNLFKNRTFVAEINEAQAKECSAVYTPSVLKSLQDRRFDLFIFDPWWPCCIALGETLKISKVVLNPANLSPMFLRAFGLHVNSALVREHSSGFPEKMNFYQRFLNVLLSYNIPVVHHNTFNDALTNVPAFDNFDMTEVTSYLDGLGNADLFISSSDPLLYPDMAETAGYISAAGLTAKDALNLNQDLENFVQSSDESGVILYSLGTYLTHVPDTFLTVLEEVFSKVPQRVIWQWKGDTPPSKKSSNVRLLKWIPQNDLLGHNQTKLLICHGGNNGLHEAIYHAVPLLVIPLGGDQFDVAQKVVEKEIGLKIEITSVTVDSVQKAIRTLLTDPRYQANINKMSTIFRDRPLSSRQKAAYWIEHVLKYGSEHIHSASRELNIWQKNLIDVYAFIMFVSCFTITGILVSVQLVLKILFRQKFENSKSKNE